MKPSDDGFARLSECSKDDAVGVGTSASDEPHQEPICGPAGVSGTESSSSTLTSVSLLGRSVLGVASGTGAYPLGVYACMLDAEEESLNVGAVALADDTRGTGDGLRLR